MADDRLGPLLNEMERALAENRDGVATLDASIAAGNKILRRKTLWIVATCVSVFLDIAITVTLAILGLQLSHTQHNTASAAAAVRANTCNLNALVVQFLANNGNTVALYRGLRPLLEASTDSNARAAVGVVDTTIAGIMATAAARAEFLAATRDTSLRLHCAKGLAAK
jgi:hypothetical protein